MTLTVVRTGVSAIALGLVVGCALRRPVGPQEPMDKVATWMLRQVAAGKKHFLVVSTDQMCAW